MRKTKNWLDSYVEFSSNTEAPDIMRWFAGVSCLAGALQRKVWIDQDSFRWYANFFIIFVAKPGIVSKTTTMDKGLDLLREIPTVHFGPDVATWQSIPPALEEVTEKFTDKSTGEELEQSALTFAVGELGNLIKPQDRDALDLFVSLWDCKRLKKVTKGSGTDLINFPWVNIIGCTTLSWIADNFPEYMIGGGLVSRCLFVYASEKKQYLAYPGKHKSQQNRLLRAKLLEDLKHVSENLVGEYALSKEAEDWGETWYTDHYNNLHNLEDQRFLGYFARKQTHLHKLAMILAASKRDALIIEKEDLIEALDWLNKIEKDMPLVFSLIGRSQLSMYAEKLIDYVNRRQKCTVKEAYRAVYAFFPDQREFEAVMAGAQQAGYMVMTHEGRDSYLTATGKVETKDGNHN